METRYIHGTSGEEHARLHAQARTLAPAVFGGLDFSEADRVVELGCGAGAECKLLLDRYPRMRLIAVDQDAEQLAGVAHHLRGYVDSGRLETRRARAEATGLPDGEADVVLMIWLLEHVADAGDILREAFRLLRPGGRLIVVEVRNPSFAVRPETEAILSWWKEYLAFQVRHGGNPEIGDQLPGLVRALETTGPARVEHLQPVDSCLHPARREELLTYMEALFLSAAEMFLAGGVKREEDVAELREAFDGLRAHPHGNVQYHAVRATVWKPEHE